MASPDSSAQLLDALNKPLTDLRSDPSLQEVEVAIVDSGIDATHQELEGRVRECWAVYRKDGETQVESRPNNENNDLFGHGTGVAGIVAEIAPNSRLFDIRVLNASNRGAGDCLVAGMWKAVESGARIVNLSLAAKRKFSAELIAVCEEAYRRNVLVVASKRNNPMDRDLGFPAELAGCIGVDATDVNNLWSLTYSRERPIEYVARGEEINTLAPSNERVNQSGTSFATPVVTGMCTLLLGKYPDLRDFEIKTILKHHAWLSSQASSAISEPH